MTRKEARAIIYNEILEATGELACLEIENVEEANCLSRLIEALEVSLEALQERPKGRWIECKDAPHLDACSECGYILRLYKNFCPNCGAVMRESE